VVSLVTSEERAIQFVDALADNATTYAAILNPNHSFWIDYPPECSLAINTLLELQIKQIRPLVFAVLQKFPPKEVEKALLLCVSWSVRFLIVGGRGGLLDQNYAEAAKGVGTGKILNARSLATSLKHIIPTDAEFQAEFAEARVTKSYLAKYYLRALELESQGTPEPELIPNNDVVLNLEHVLPENPGSNWPGVDSEIAEGFRRRLGNMVLLPHTKNSKIGNKSFTEKRKVLRASSLQLTSDVGKEKSWGVKEITARQQKLAALAVKTWPLSLS
jgi:hypothetical protein